MDLILSKDDQMNLWDFSCKLAKSKMVPVMFQNKNEDVFVAILMGKELGLNPIMSLGAIVVIQNTVTLKVQTMNAVVRSKCPDAIIDIKMDMEKRECRVIAKRNKDEIGYESVWTMGMAKSMGLTSKNNWVTQWWNMLKARALSDALRAVFPDILLGLYSTEEMSDLPPITQEQSLLESVKADAEAMYLEQRKPEDSQYGPLFLVENGKHRGMRLHEICPLEIEEYLHSLRQRGTHKNWEKGLMAALEDYLANMGTIYKEQIFELNEAKEE